MEDDGCKDFGCGSTTPIIYVPGDDDENPDDTLGGGTNEDPEDAAYDVIANIEDPWAMATAYMGTWYYFSAWKIDAWLYRNVPSAFGVTVSGSGGWSYGLGPVVDLSPTTYIFNWRSFELDVVSTTDGGLSLGVPPGASASLYASVFAVKGASSNSSWFGKYASVAAQGYAGLGAVGGVSLGLDDDFKPHIDPVSGGHVWTFFGGGGLGTSQLGVTATRGSTFLEEGVFDLDLPISPIPPNNPYLHVP